MLTDGEAKTVKERAYKYSPAENIKPLNVTTVSEEVWAGLPSVGPKRWI